MWKCPAYTARWRTRRPGSGSTRQSPSRSLSTVIKALYYLLTTLNYSFYHFVLQTSILGSMSAPTRSPWTVPTPRPSSPATTSSSTARTTWPPGIFAKYPWLQTCQKVTRTMLEINDHYELRKREICLQVPAQRRLLPGRQAAGVRLCPQVRGTTDRLQLPGNKG